MRQNEEAMFTVRTLVSGTKLSHIRQRDQTPVSGQNEKVRKADRTSVTDIVRNHLLEGQEESLLVRQMGTKLEKQTDTLVCEREDHHPRKAQD